MASIPVASIDQPRHRANFNAASTTLQAVACLLVIGIVFLNAADFRGGTGETFSVHWQIYLRLLVCATSGCTAILLLHRSLQPFFTFPGLMMTGLIVWLGVSCIGSVNRNYSVVAYGCLGAIVMLTPALMSILGGFRFLASIGIGLLSYLVGSWIAYIAFPSVGLFHEQVSQTEVFDRMGGLGHPNELGFVAACSVVLFGAFHYCKRISFAVAAPLVLFGVITLLACYSRTSLILTSMGLLMVYRKEIFRESFMTWAILGAMLVVLVGGYSYATGELDWVISDSMTKLSKSGNSDELTTGTGRTNIWAYGIKLISERPLAGYGYAAHRFVMDEHSFHCHNSFLNYCMSGGLLAGILFLGMAGYLVRAMWMDPRPEIDGLLTLILLGGLAEGVLSAATPNGVMLLFVAGLFWRQLEM